MTLHSSQLGRGGHRDDRRRRLLAEDLSANLDPPAQAQSGSPAGRPIAHKSVNYGDAEFLQTQPRLADLVPRRLIVVALLPLGGSIVIAGLAMLYSAAPRLLHTPGHWPGIAVLGGPGSLSNWFSSLLLLMATFYAVVNYTVRRYKVDDYRGRYRVWLWAAVCCFLMATDASASLHQGLQEALVSLSGTRIVGDGSVWWLAPAALLLGFVGTRLLIDVWPCRLASSALVLAAVAHLAALVPFFGLVRLPSDVAKVVLLNGLLLAGHLLLASSLVLHARFVLLDAEGRLLRSAARPPTKRKRGEKSKTRPAVTEATGLPEGEVSPVEAERAEAGANASQYDRTTVPTQPGGRLAAGPTSGSPVLRRVDPPLAARVKSVAQNNAAAPDSSPSSFEGANGRLSKADRKALKNKLLQERLKAEQRKAANW